MRSLCKESQSAVISLNPRASTISCIDRRKSEYGSGESVGMAMLPTKDAKEEDIEDDDESIIELERPGVEKKKRREA